MATRLQPPADTERDHVLGPADAGVTVVEYGDYECPYCRRARVGVEHLRTGPLEGRMRYVFRHFPNARAHPHARAAFGDPSVLALAKINVMSASLVAAVAGWLVLPATSPPTDQRTPAAEPQEGRA